MAFCFAQHEGLKDTNNCYRENKGKESFGKCQLNRVKWGWFFAARFKSLRRGLLHGDCLREDNCWQNFQDVSHLDTALSLEPLFENDGLRH